MAESLCSSGCGLIFTSLSAFDARFEGRTTAGYGGCWLWAGRLDRGGYGQITVGGRRPMVHRHAYELVVGPIAEGLTLDHLCRVRHCVHPCHMEPVTQQVNNHRGYGFPGENVRKTHCVRGHPLTVDNIYESQLPRRVCRRCAVANAASRVHEVTCPVCRSPFVRGRYRTTPRTCSRECGWVLRKEASEGARGMGGDGSAVSGADVKAGGGA